MARDNNGNGEMVGNTIVKKLWNFCHTLRDDGVGYGDYVEQLTCLLFLKLAEERKDQLGAKIPEKYSWNSLKDLTGMELKKHYETCLRELAEVDGIVGDIYADSANKIREPANLAKLVALINEIDWAVARGDGIGDLYEGLLEKNASEKKSGAGQYFTPRALIDAMVEVMDPDIGMKINDPACGTLGFLIAARQHILQKHDGGARLDRKQKEQLKSAMWSAGELVGETRRLALMNMLLHGMNFHVHLGDTLGESSLASQQVDMLLTNPPFGTKRGGEAPIRSDFLYKTSNKQLNFVQHVMNVLKPGAGRAAVVVPDNVLFEGNVGRDIRRKLLDDYNLHTILRLPTGLFYAQGVKTNVIFFSRAGATKETWVYDFRTNIDPFGVTKPFTRQHLDDFVKCTKAKKRAESQRWKKFTLDEIKARDYNLDISWLKDESLANADNLGDPAELADEALVYIKEAMRELEQVKGMLNG